MTTRGQIIANAVLAAALLLWTAGAAASLWWGTWTLNVDTSCDGPVGRTLDGGGWLAFVVPPVWVLPFVAVAARRRSVAWSIVAALSIALAIALVWAVATAGPTRLCW